MIDRTSRDDAFDPAEPSRDELETSRSDPGSPRPEQDAGRSDRGKKADHDVLQLAHSDEAREPTSSDGKDAPQPPPKAVFIVAALLLCLLVAWGGYEHWQSYSDSKATTDHAVNDPIEVRTTAAKRLDQPIDLTLPGETQALDTANIFPRATGYIDKRLVDIGSRLKKGDMMVHIAAPDLDQQLAQAQAQIGQTEAALVQAKAQVAQAEANVNLAQVNLARASTLTQQGYETQQNRDTQQANTQTQQANVESAKAGVTVAEANIKAQQAVIDRLKALTAFEDVRAPFDGVVTARNVDIGELVSADQSTGTPMFTAVRDSVMRVIVRVPQNVSDGIRDGLEAKIDVPQTPQKVFTGKVTRTSSAVLYSSRTLTTEVDIPNESGALRPGLYVTVSFAVPRTGVQVEVPAEALIFDQHGVRVATLDGDTVKMVQVNIARDEGKTLILQDGLKGGERLVLNPAATLKDGAKVKETREEDEKKQDQQPQASSGGDGKQPAADSQKGG